MTRMTCPINLSRFGADGIRARCGARWLAPIRIFRRFERWGEDM